MASAWLEVFKSGTHTSGNGVTKTYTDDDLNNMAKLYNEQKEHEAPLVLGHPKTDDPAFGWAKELKKAGNKLLAYVDGISDGIVDAVKKGSYKKISIALYPDGLLRHIGLLGATPPAVKGLAPVQFAEELEFEEYVWATDEYRMPIVARMLSGIRDLFIEKFGLDLTDKVIGKGDLESLHDPAKSTMLVIKDKSNASEDILIPPPGAITNNYSEQEEIIMEKLKQQVADLESKIAAQATQFSESQTAFQASIQKSIDDLTLLVTGKIKKDEETAKTTAFESAKTAFASFCEDLIKAGKILPAEKDSVIEEYADLLMAEGTMTFAETDVRPSEKMKTRLEARPVIFAVNRPIFANGNNAKPKVEGIPAEFADMEVDPNSVEIDKAIKEYAEANKCSYEEAAAAYGQA